MFKIAEQHFYRIVKKWNSYKYRFVPWIATNVQDKHWTDLRNYQVCAPQELVKSLIELLAKFEDYSQLKDDLELYARWGIRFYFNRFTSGFTTTHVVVFLNSNKVPHCDVDGHLPH